MSVLFHSLVALTYIALGAAAAFGLPLLSVTIEPVLALFAGGAVLIGGAMLFFIVLFGPTEFLLNADHEIITATYSAGPIGRMNAPDLVKVVQFNEKKRMGG